MNFQIRVQSLFVSSNLRKIIMNHEGFTRIEGFTKGMKGSTRRYNFVIETNDHILFPQLKKMNFVSIQDMHNDNYLIK